MPETGVYAMVDAALASLVEARRRSASATPPELDPDALRRLEVAITAAHTVVDPPSMPTDALRAKGLWWDDWWDESGGTVVTPEEVKALRACIRGDAFDPEAINSFMAKTVPEGF